MVTPKTKPSVARTAIVTIVLVGLFFGTMSSAVYGWLPLLEEDRSIFFGGGGGGGGGSPRLTKDKSESKKDDGSTEKAVKTTVAKSDGPVVDSPSDELAREIFKSPDVRAAAKEVAIAELNHRKQSLSDRNSIVGYRNLADAIIFLMAHALMGVGCWAGWREFQHANELRSKRARKTAPTAPEQTEIEVGLEKIAVKTSLHGLLLFACTFGFYLAYLTLVHPVQVIK